MAFHYLLFKIDSFCNNDKIVLSNIHGAYSESLGEIGITSMIYFSYNMYSYIKKMKNKKCDPSINSIINKKTLLIMEFVFQKKLKLLI